MLRQCTSICLPSCSLQPLHYRSRHGRPGHVSKTHVLYDILRVCYEIGDWFSAYPTSSLNGNSAASLSKQAFKRTCAAGFAELSARMQAATVFGFLEFQGSAQPRGASLTCKRSPIPLRSISPHALAASLKFMCSQKGSLTQSCTIQLSKLSISVLFTFRALASRHLQVDFLGAADGCAEQAKALALCDR